MLMNEMAMNGDVGVHYIGEVHKPWTVLRRLFDVITDGKLEWEEMDLLFDQVVIGDKKFSYIAGKDAFIEEMQKNFPDEVDAIDKYVELLY